LIKRETSVNLLVSNIIGLMRLSFTILVCLLVLLVVTPSLRATDVQWPAKLGKLTAEFPNRNMAPVRAGLAPVAKESGFTGLSTQTYEYSVGKGSQMILYAHRDSSGAYEDYTFLRAQPPTAVNPANSMLVKGNLVLWISANAILTPEDREAVEIWLQSVSDGVASPPIASYLPDKNRLELTERYALGSVAFRQAATELGRPEVGGLVDAAGFNSGAEAMFARYKSGKNEATLLLIEYPTPQLAELHLRHLQRALHDAKLGTSSVERKGSLLSIVLAPTSAEYAEKLRGAVNYETEVTWNEPSSTATDPPITSTLVKIILATGVFMVVTLVLGIAFGGVRVITKRLFPGKVFDRPAQMEVLQLGLSGKPIDPRDMY
jgi:hypothetical protein